MAVVTTGFFDGVHLGHRHVIETVVSSARERGEEAVVVSFWPHPRAVLQQDARDLRLLSTLEEKKAMLLSLGIDRVEVLPFTREFAALTAAQYLDMLRDRYGATLVVMGYDNKIGADMKTAEELTETYCFRNPSDLRSSSLPTSLRAVGPLPFMWPRAATGSGEQYVSVSSTKIRKLLSEGDVEGGNAMLGYEYTLTGAVVAGNRMGRTIGFPTANMQLYEPLKLVPGNGVYAVDVEVLGAKWRGMCNIGTRPTVGGASRTIETHILDFDQDIYGLPLTIRFGRRIRDERKFPSLDALRDQLVADRNECRKIQSPA
ncbi:MAG: bifunctional riboflavin kinase/FMN adenylyltransferase [Bacteroidales bacterium]|nr:bifunctional riboflavin kinase/FMN adenylyltransferase [Bacteroidales bacterium]